jgi:hypothetical protein
MNIACKKAKKDYDFSEPASFEYFFEIINFTPINHFIVFLR